MNRVLPLIVVAFVVALAVPAGAQERDPFVPLVSDDPAGTTTTTGDAPAPAAPPVPEPDAEAVPNTGTNVLQFVGLAVALIGIGGAALLAATALSPRRIPHRAGSVA